MSCSQTSLMSKTSPTQLVGTVQGHLDEVAARLLGTLAERIAHTTGLQVVLDVSEAGDLSPPGVAALYELQRLVVARSGALQVRGASSSLQRDLTVAGPGALLYPPSSMPPDPSAGAPR